jgi:preprotein translocase subunit YajC
MGGMLFPMLLFLPIIFLLFWNSRSQQKKQQKALQELKKGDRVVTQSGMVGKLVELGDRYAKVEIAPGVKVELLKSGIVGKDSGESAPPSEKK